MAYSDYGGYAYRDGRHIPERSDAVITAEGIKSTCGMWPGWTIPESREGGSYHALLGDGEILVGLYKQSSLSLFLNGEDFPILGVIKAKYPESIKAYDGKEYWDSDYFRDNELTMAVDVGPHKLEAFFEYSDNYYLFVRLTQEDGAVWTGWSGYGVGAGLEDAGYGFSTDSVAQNAVSHWERLDAA